MKRILLIALTLLSAQAFASRARQTALGGSYHLVDTYNGYSAGLDLLEFSSFVDLETGLTTPTGITDGANGLMSYSFDDKSRLAVGVGYIDSIFSASRDYMNNAAGTSYGYTQNPAHIVFAHRSSEDFSYSFGMSYSHQKDKIAGTGEASSSASLGLQFGGLQVYNTFALINTVDAAGAKKFDGKGDYDLSAYYGLGDFTINLGYNLIHPESSTSGTVDQSLQQTTTKVGFVNSHKVDNNDVFWSLNYQQVNSKNKLTGTTTKSTTLPIWIGFEANANDWLVARGSIKQTLPMGNAEENVNQTEAAAGVGFKMNSITLDATLAGLVGGTASQKIDGNDLLGQVGLVYKF